MIQVSWSRRLEFTTFLQSFHLFRTLSLLPVFIVGLEFVNYFILIKEKQIEFEEFCFVISFEKII